MKKAFPWEVLYTDDLVLIAENEDLKERLCTWRNCMKSKYSRVNIVKTKVVSGRKEGTVKKVRNWPCTVCSKGVGRNSI